MDLLLPDFNLVIELMGPQHYTKPGFTKNLITVSRERALKKLGYNFFQVEYMEAGERLMVRLEQTLKEIKN